MFQIVSFLLLPGGVTAQANPNDCALQCAPAVDCTCEEPVQAAPVGGHAAVGGAGSGVSSGHGGHVVQAVPVQQAPKPAPQPKPQVVPITLQITAVPAGQQPAQQEQHVQHAPVTHQPVTQPVVGEAPKAGGDCKMVCEDKGNECEEFAKTHPECVDHGKEEKSDNSADSSSWSRSWKSSWSSATPGSSWEWSSSTGPTNSSSNSSSNKTSS